MAYMAAQFLTGNSNRSYCPIEVAISDNRKSTYEKKYDGDEIECILTFKTVDVGYQCQSCKGYKYRLRGNGPFHCNKCNKRLSVSFIEEGNKYQEVMLKQAEVENLLEGLLLKTSKKIHPETKVKLMGLLSIEGETE